MKYGVIVPHTEEEAEALDKAHNHDLWTKALKKEETNVLVAFRLLGDGEPLPVRSMLIPYHIIFDMKHDLTRKARLVAGRHHIPDIRGQLIFSSVVSRERYLISNSCSQ